MSNLPLQDLYEGSEARFYAIFSELLRDAERRKRRRRLEENQQQEGQQQQPQRSDQLQDDDDDDVDIEDMRGQQPNRVVADINDDDDDDDDNTVDAPDNGNNVSDQNADGDAVQFFDFDNYKEMETDGTYKSFIRIARDVGIIMEINGNDYIDLSGFERRWEEMSQRLILPQARVYSRQLRRIVLSSRYSDFWAYDHNALFNLWIYRLIHASPNSGRMWLSADKTKLFYKMNDTSDPFYNCMLFVMNFLSMVRSPRIRRERLGLKGRLFFINEKANEVQMPIVEQTIRDNIANISNRGVVNADVVIRIAFEMRLRMHAAFENSKDLMQYSDMWEDRDSGTTVAIYQAGDFQYYFQLLFKEAITYSMGECWKAIFDKVLDDVFPDGGICAVTNECDVLCFIYTLIMGLIKIKHPKWFQFRTRVSPLELDQYVHRESDVHPDALSIMRKCIKEHQSDIVSRMIEGERMENSRMTTLEAREFFSFIENTLITDKNVAIDVVAAVINKEGKVTIYPCYASKRRVKERILICNVCIKEGPAHYVLVTNPRKLFRGCEEGKIFYTCSKCKQTFFTMSFLQQHIYNGQCTEDNVRKYHWNATDAQERDDDGIEQGARCVKCHLKFDSVFASEHHAKYCFMKNKSGSRYVKLLPPNEQFLKGEIVESTYDPIAGVDYKEIWYADFECSIDPETGYHNFMSYGLYCKLGENYGERFHIGFSIVEFLDILAERVQRDNRLNQRKIWVYFHNAMNYDANFILREVLSNEKYKKWSVKVLMKSASQMQALRFTFRGRDGICEIVIGDTFRFFAMSLDAIVKCMKKETNKDVFPAFFRIMNKQYNVTDSSLEKILQKNLFPYKFFTSKEKLLTPIEEFKEIFEAREENLQYYAESVTVSELASNKSLFDDVCSVFKIRKAVDYHNLYLSCDVLQLADMFTSARERLYVSHKIDISNYVGLPAATWHAFLRFNPDLRLPLYSDTIYAEFFKSMTRGGVTIAPLRYAESDDSHSIFYFDFNGLYPHAMRSFAYPCGMFSWYIPRKEAIDHCGGDNNKWLKECYFPNLAACGRGACLKVDLHIPTALHDYFNAYPPAPTHERIYDEYFTDTMELYPYLKKWSEANGGAKMKPFYGLVGTLKDKIEYGVHWKLLEWYIDHGVEVTKIHHSVEFNELKYLEGYISMNIEKRDELPKNDTFGRMFFKGMNNSFYGKTFEDTFNRANWTIVRGNEKLAGVLEEGNVTQIIGITHDAWFVKIDGDEVILDKPTYIGACVTEYAKLLMYQLIYDWLPKAFETRNIELCYSDTDSVIVRVEHKSGMSAEDLFELAERNMPGLIGPNGGQIKSETGYDLIDKVVAARAKLYAFVTKEGHLDKHAKGVCKAVQKKDLTFETYIDLVFGMKNVMVKNAQIRRKAGHVYSEIAEKVGLSPNDGKLIIDDDGIHTRAVGHYSLVSHLQPEA